MNVASIAMSRVRIGNIDANLSSIYLTTRTYVSES